MVYSPIAIIARARSHVILNGAERANVILNGAERSEGSASQADLQGSGQNGPSDVSGLRLTAGAMSLADPSVAGRAAHVASSPRMTPKHGKCHEPV